MHTRDDARQHVFSINEAPQNNRHAAKTAMLDKRTIAQHLDSLDLRS